jgi:hypothetical protein
MPLSTHLEDSDLESYIHDRSDPASASSIQSHVRQCAACEERLVSSMIALLGRLKNDLRDDDQERRIDQRMQTGDCGFLQTLCPLSFEHMDIQILDVSKKGMGVHVSAFLPSGTIVQVMAGATAVLGEVKYCRKVEGGKFHAGIRLRPVVRKAGRAS